MVVPATSDPPQRPATRRFRRAGWLVGGLALLVIGALVGYPRWVRWRAAGIKTQCIAARDARQWKELQELSEKWIAFQPYSAEAHLFRAEAAQRQGNFAEAAASLKAVPETDSKALPVLVALSSLQFGPLNRPLDGVETCERILAREPLATTAHHQLIEFYAYTLQREKLIAQIRRAIELAREPKSAYVYFFLVDTMRLANGVELNQKWLETSPDDEIFLVGAALQRPEPEAGRPDSENKQKILEPLFRRFPENIELLAYHVDLAVRRGDVPQLLTLLQQAPAAADHDGRFWRARGWLHLNRNELSKAREALTEALALHPMDWDARNWLADVTRKEGELQEADRLQELVRRARRLREKLTGSPPEAVPQEILVELANFARDCGETQVAEALRRRLQSKD